MVLQSAGRTIKTLGLRSHHEESANQKIRLEFPEKNE